MADLNVKVDMGRVQSTVQAAIRPAVEEALATYDIKAAINRQLTEKPPKKEKDRLGFPYLMFGDYRPQDISTLLDNLIRESIRELAKAYVRSNIAMQRGEIEEAFRKMMNGSTNRLTKAFAGAVEKALEADWGFDLNIAVAHRVSEKDRDDD